MKKDKENRRKRRHNSNENCEDAVENERSTTSKPSTSTKRSRIEEQESFTVEAEGNNPNESKARSAGVMEKAKVKEGGNPSDDVDSVVTTVTRSEQSEQLKEENDASVRKTENTQSSTTDDVQQRQNLNTEDAQQVQADDQPQRKRKRRVRVKKVREDLRQQMEFYFCDANLRKDRYMTELVSKNENGWVEVVEFLKFNKIKALLEEKDLEIGEVVKAVRGSEVIEVSDDLKKIRRNLEKHPVKPKSQQMIDDCTVYVQGLQSIASVEWLRGNFTEFGQVDYVSLPRGPNGRHKGFGFIEFADVASAENACKFYSLQGGRINGPGGSCLDAVGRSWVHGGSGSFGNNLKSNHTNSSASNNGHSQQLAQRANLQVISKKEWTSYKNRYLKLRKKSATIAKKYLNAVAEKNRSSAADKHDGLQHEQARKGRRQNNRGGGQSVDPDSEHTAKKARQIDEKEQKGNDSLDEKPNGNLRTTKQVDEPTTAQENELIVQGQNEAGEEMKKFTKGCIIKIEARKGLLRTDKALMRSIPGVAFVDMIENDPVAFVRFNNPEEAEIFAASHSGSGSNQQNGENEQKINQGDDVPKQEVGDMLDNLGVKHCSVLRDEEEVNYWQRVELMRGRKKQSSSTAKKYKNNASRNQTDAQSKSNRKSRGKQRLKEKYEKYTHEVDKQIEVRMNKRIVFDD